MTLYPAPEGSWPGTYQLTEQWEDPNSGDKFWKWTFEGVTTISFLFNNGDATDTKQTGNVENVTSDRYFILNWDDGSGYASLEDVTENYIVIPDAEVNSLGISGNHNGWGLSDGSEFTLVGGKTFTATIDLTGYDIPNDIWEFKLRPNLSGWVGYYEVTIDGNIPSWLSDNYGNFMVDLTQTGRIFNITATWAGGKNITQGWRMKITTSNSGGGGIIIPGITELFQMNGEQYGLVSDYQTEVSENYYWYGGKNMEVYNAFTDSYKLVNINSANGYNRIAIDDNIIYTENGVQGSTNPKQAL